MMADRQPILPLQRALRFCCQGSALFGILTLPPASAPPQARGVLIVTGGPQYRAGSHRQFTLLANTLATRGYPVLRFDYRGMGDSDGAPHDFEDIGDDLDSAMAAFFHQVPALRQLVLWGLCDGATAAALQAYREPRIAGLILLNPWVRTEAGAASATLRHYYGRRLLQPDFWWRLISGGVRPVAALAGWWRLLVTARRRGAAAPVGAAASAGAASAASGGALPQRLLAALTAFDGPVLLILSGDDLTAREFDDLQRTSRAWRAWRQRARIRVTNVAGANHTFARAEWRDAVAQHSADWLATW